MKKHLTPLPVLLGICITFFAFVRGSEATTIIRNPVADTFITNGNATNVSPDNNYGLLGAMTLAGANTGRDGVYHSLLRFNLAGIATDFDATYGAGNWFPTSLSLTLGSTLPTAGDEPNNNRFPSPIADGPFSISWSSNSTWVEDTVTWNNFSPGTVESMGQFNYLADGTAILTWSLTSSTGFLNDLNNGSATSLLLTPESATVNYLFNSRAFSTEANRPVLSVTAIPEPGAVALVFLAGLIFACKRQPSFPRPRV